MSSYRTTRGLEHPSDLERFAGIVARLEGCDVETAQGFIASLTGQLGAAFQRSLIFVTAELEESVLGAVLLRPTPKGSFELFGGVPDHTDRAAVSEALLCAAQALGAARGLSTFASVAYWDVATLERVGFREVAQYERFESNQVRLSTVNPPAGFTISNFKTHPEFEDLLAGLRFYEDQWGHHHVDADAVRQGLAAYDPAHIWIVRDTAARAAGLCRATLSPNGAWIDAPSVRADLRGQGLHLALLTRTLEGLTARGASSFSLESWGEGPANRADSFELGFRSVERTPLVAWMA